MKLQPSHWLLHQHADVHKYCKTCKTTNASLFKCSDCFIGVYCSSDCQQADYKEHRTMCSNSMIGINEGEEDAPKRPRDDDDDEERRVRARQEPNILTVLPEALVREILRNLSYADLTNVRLVSKLFGKYGAYVLVSEFTLVVATLAELMSFGTDPELQPLWPHIRSLAFRDAFNESLLPVANRQIFPPNLKDLTFGDWFDQQIPPGVLPQSLEMLTFGNEFDDLIEVGVLPQSLTHLVFGEYFNQPIGIGVLPQSLEHLEFGADFDQPIAPGVLPQSLTTLFLGFSYSNPIARNVLPPSLIVLRIGHDFNQPIEPGVLPQSLAHLTLGNLFNQPIELGVFPESLRGLHFGTNFNQRIIAGVLPRSLARLTLGAAFNQPLIKVLPHSLKRLILKGVFIEF